jgi:hypothetical protein
MSSNKPFRPIASFRGNAAVGGAWSEADINRLAKPADSVKNDPSGK